MKTTFPAKRAGSTILLPFDFTNQLAVGDSLSIPTVVASVYSGVDPTPSAILSGSPSVSGNVVTQKVTVGVPGTIYSLLCTVTTSQGATLELQGFLAISQNAV